MRNFTLPRSSWAYKFVFGQQFEYRMEGFIEPLNDRISLGLFSGMFLFMIVMRPLGFLLMTFMEVMSLFVSFLIDGSYSRGSFPIHIQFIKIEPWPRLLGRRLSPFIVIAIGTVLYQYLYVEKTQALWFLAGFLFVIYQFKSIKPGDKSLAMELAEKTGPAIDEKIVLSYYKEPKIFPALYLTS